MSTPVSATNGKPGPAPDGFEFDETRVEAVLMHVLFAVDEELWLAAHRDRLSWAASLDERNVPLIVLFDKATGSVRGTLRVDWRDVAKVNK